MEIIVLMSNNAVWNDNIRKRITEDLKTRINEEFEIVDIKRTNLITSNSDYYCADKKLLEFDTKFIDLNGGWLVPLTSYKDIKMSNIPVSA